MNLLYNVCLLVYVYYTQVTEPHELPRKKVCRRVLLYLAKILPKWEMTARALGLEDHVVGRLKADNPHNVREQCIQMLSEWKLKYPSDDNYQVLGRELCEYTSIYRDYVKFVECHVSSCQNKD